VDVQINVLPGMEDGMSKVMINPQRKKKWGLRASYNNYGDARTGEQLISGVGYLFNYAKLSDLFYIAGTGSHTGAYKTFSSYYSFPFGYSDFSFYFSNSKSVQNINVGSHVFDYIGKTKYFNFKTNRMLYRI
jgi:hemolysin activation/secretion protein